MDALDRAQEGQSAAMQLALQNAETINRLVEQGEVLLKSFHDEHRKTPRGWKRSSPVANWQVGVAHYTLCIGIARKTSSTALSPGHA
jgi:hypothetical protein